MMDWHDLSPINDPEDIAKILHAGQNVMMRYPGKDANTINDAKEALAEYHRLIYKEDIQIDSITRDICGVLYMAFSVRKETE